VRRQATGLVRQPRRDARELAVRTGCSHRAASRIIVACRCTRHRTGYDDVVLVEGFIAGREFAIQGVLTDGVLRVFAISDKPDPLDGPFFEETIYVTPSALAEEDRGRLLTGAARG
jgi:hypothetical protein